MNASGLLGLILFFGWAAAVVVALEGWRWRQKRQEAAGTAPPVSVEYHAGYFADPHYWRVVAYPGGPPVPLRDFPSRNRALRFAHDDRRVLRALEEARQRQAMRQTIHVRAAAEK